MVRIFPKASCLFSGERAGEGLKQQLLQLGGQF